MICFFFIQAIIQSRKLSLVLFHHHQCYTPIMMDIVLNFLRKICLKREWQLHWVANLHQIYIIISVSRTTHCTTHWRFQTRLMRIWRIRIKIQRMEGKYHHYYYLWIINNYVNFYLLVPFIDTWEFWKSVFRIINPH